MSLRVCAVEPQDSDEVRAFIASTFHVSVDATFLKTDLFSWKYFQPRPDWDGPRNWVVRMDGRIVAHIGVWPLTLRSPTGAVTFVHAIDWAASSDFPGAGILLFRNFLARTGTVAALGGTDHAKRLLPSLGFTQRGRVDIYAKWFVPPSLRANTQAAVVARRGLGIARELLLRPLTQRHLGGWTAEPVSAFPERLNQLIESSRSGDCSFLWTGVGTLNFVLSCPIQSCKGFLLRRNGELRGYFILARPGNQTRIADLRVDSISPEDWKAAYLVATEQARADPEAHEVIAFCSTELVREALKSHGFVVKSARDIRWHDHKKRITADAIQFHPIATDAFFLYNPKFPYLTSSRNLRKRAAARLKRWMTRP
jgi:hypothetical protein